MIKHNNGPGEKSASDNVDPTPLGGDRPPVTPRGTDLPDVSFLSAIESIGGHRRFLSQGAKAYIDQLGEELKRLGCKEYEIEPLTIAQCELLAISCDSKRINIVLAFQETYQPGVDEAPIATISSQLAKQFGENGRQLVDCYTITPDDYPLVEKMAAFIKTVLTCITNTSILTKGRAMLENSHFTVSRDLNLVKQIIEEHSPQAAQARIDYGIVVKVHNRPEDGRHVRANDPGTPLLAMGAYTTFETRSGEVSGEHEKKCIIPTVHISQIVTPVMNTATQALVFPLAYQAFIARDEWSKGYRKYKANEWSLGAMVVDSDGMALEILNDQQFDRFLEVYVEEPFLAVDVVNGRTRPAGMFAFAYDAAALTTQICDMFGVSEPVNPIDRNKVESFIGPYNAELSDSRELDYMHLVENGDGGAVNSASKSWLAPTYDALKDIQTIKGMFGSFNPIYHNISVVIDGGFVVGVNNALDAMTTIDFNDNDSHRRPTTLRGGSGNDYSGATTLGAPTRAFNVGRSPYSAKY